MCDHPPVGGAGADLRNALAYVAKTVLHFFPVALLPQRQTPERGWETDGEEAWEQVHLRGGGVGPATDLSPRVLKAPFEMGTGTKSIFWMRDWGSGRLSFVQSKDLNLGESDFQVSLLSVCQMGCFPSTAQEASFL